MPRVSKSKLHVDRLKEIEDHFSHLISSLTNSNEIEDFFEGFFTKEEKVMLAKRLVLYMMLKKDYPPSAISSALHMSYETIRSHANQMSGKKDKFFVIIDKLIAREKTNEFFKKIESILKPIDLAMRARNDMKARAKLASGDWS
ncbi:MAG: hypothetical protein HYZ02_03050 [Candidatus Levybacteria bacterium]|nr:hypothetical protein [Candidatus Levybacteria bacterium]